MNKYSFRISFRVVSATFVAVLVNFFLIGLNSCTESDNNVNEPGLVINEIMASNHSGITAQDGKLHDWIEIKNTSDHATNLKDYTLVLEKISRKVENKGEVKRKTWELPDREVAAGECVIVFASKKGKKQNNDEKEKEKVNELHANFKLPSTGAKIQLMHDSEVISEATYCPLESDQCYRRVNDTIYESSYEPTPGFDNTPQGYEAYNVELEKHRSGPLRLWELQCHGYYQGKAWVEVKNVSDKPVSLQDYCLATSKKHMNKWSFPEVTLQPGEIYVVNSRRGEFKISDTKSVMLTRDGKFVDGLCGISSKYGTTVGRVDGKHGIYYFESATRGNENTQAHYRYIANEPSFITKPGAYDTKNGMSIILDTHGNKVHYTTDGSEPTQNSPLYNDSIRIEKTCMVRAYCEGDSVTMRSNTVVNTFILDETHTIAVMNITVDNNDLYDKNRGIYAEGPGYTAEYPHIGANYWKPWWKQAHVQFYDNIPGQDGFSVDCELAIFGGFSRTLSKKSFKIRFKHLNGPSRLTYDFFGDGQPIELKKLVLRSGSQDITGAMIRDEYFTSLMQENSPTLLTQAYRPIALYINGEYFGLYYLREKIDDDFVARHLNVSNDSISIIMSGLYCEEGSKVPYNQLVSYVSSHDISKDEHYYWVKDHFDLDGLIDWKLGEIYSGKIDAGNVRFVLPQDPDSDGKWHVVFYDIDASWGKQSRPASFHLRVGGSQVVRAVNFLSHHLLKNKNFRLLFLEHLSHHLHSTFTYDNVTKRFDELVKTITPEMKRNCERWPKLMSYKRWENNIEKFREKFKGRDKVVLNSLRQELKITEEENKKYFGDL